MKRSVLLTAVLFVVSTAIGILAPPSYFRDSLTQMRQMLEPLHSIGQVGLFTVIFLNNSIKAFLVIVSGILLGLPPLLFIVFNGLTLGALITATAPVVGWAVITAGLVPHGVIELPLLIFSSALGFLVGREAFKGLAGHDSQVKATLLRSIKLYFKWVLGGLLVAAAIEAFVTSYVVKLAGG